MADMLYKFIVGESAEIKGFDDKERTFTAWASRSSMDRDEEEIDASGWLTKDFRKNPVVPLFHDYHQFPVAKSLWEKPDPKQDPIGLLFKPQFAETYLGMETYYLYKEGYMNAFSVGFDPLEWIDSEGNEYSKAIHGEFAVWQKGYIEQKKKKPRCRFTKQILLEISGVLVPAHPDALVEARSFAHTPELKKYLDDMIEKSRKPMILIEPKPEYGKAIGNLEEFYFEACIDGKRTFGIEAIKSIKHYLIGSDTPLHDHTDINASDLIDIQVDDGSDPELFEVETDALGDGGDTSEFIVEVLVEAGDDAELIEIDI